MKFALPWFLLGGVAASGLLVWLFYWLDRRNRRTLAELAAPRLLEKLVASVSERRRWIKRWLLVLAVFFLFVALARPQWGYHWQEVKRRGIDILFVIDTSKSMLAQDVKPDRLTRAKFAVMDLLQKLQSDRVGLIAFAGKSFLQCPLTLDHEAFALSLNALDTQIISRGGTDLASAVVESQNALQTQSANHKFLILITDGEDHEGRALNAARQAAQEGVTIFTVGVGTPGGDLIPLQNSQNGAQFVKDEQGRVVKSRLDEQTLRAIAEATDGFYVPLGRRGEGLEKIYDEVLKKIPKQELKSRMKKVFIDRFQWPLALAILLLVFEFLLRDRRAGSREDAPPSPHASRRDAAKKSHRM